MRDLGFIEHFVAGAVGPPGHRVFLVEIDPGTGLEWYLAEKGQVGMLAAAALDILQQWGGPASAAGPDVSEPGEIGFRLGRIGIGMAADEILIELHPADPDEGDIVAFQVAAPVLEGMARRAVQVVASGRPLCPMCGLPKDTEGHGCPASNGDLRSGS